MFMKELNINWEDKVVKHKGHEISLGSIKGKLKELTPKIVDHYRFDKKFNKITGKIESKVAWDSVFFIFHKGFDLRNLFDLLLEESGYGKRKQKKH
jgi:hypothetical protein